MFGSNLVPNSANSIGPEILIGGYPCVSPYKYATAAGGVYKSAPGFGGGGANIVAVTCVMTPGYGSGLTVTYAHYYTGIVINIPRQPVPTASGFTYAAPTVTAQISAAYRANFVLTIFGSNFGIKGKTTTGSVRVFNPWDPRPTVTFSTPTVTVGTTPCVTPEVVTDSVMVCLIPAGGGVGLSVEVTAGNQNNAPNTLFSYEIPTVTAVQPASALSTGIVAGSTYTLYGTRFTSNPGTVVITHDGLECGSLSGWTTNLILSSVVCENVPVSCGTIPAVIVTTGYGQVSIGNISLSYAPANISSMAVSWDFANSAVITPVRETSNFTMLGTGFGNSSLNCSSLGISNWGLPALTSNTTCGTFTFTDTSAVCSGVPYSTPGKRRIMVSANASATLSGPTTEHLDYGPPLVTAVSLDPLGAVGYPSTAGGATLVLEGWFGDFLPSGATFAGWSVSVGTIPCGGPITWVSPYMLTCLVPAGEGQGLNVTASVDEDDTSTTTLVSGAMASAFTYAAPNVTYASLIDADSGGLLTLYGFDFGTSTPAITVGSSSCTPVTRVSHTHITCTAPPGAGLGISLRLARQDGQNFTDNLVSYLAPTVTAIVPASGPTLAAFTFTLYGTNFGPVAAAPAVTVEFSWPGGNKATSPSGACSVTAVGAITCPAVSMPGYGAGVGVNVTVASQLSELGGLAAGFTYKRPLITAFIPPAVNQGDPFTVVGSNFGPQATHPYLPSIIPDVQVELVVGDSSSYAPCGVTPVLLSDSLTLCSSAPGPAFGIAHHVKMTLSNDTGGPSTSTGVLDYSPPIVSAVQPATSPSVSAPGSILTIYGANFGGPSTNGLHVIQVGTFPCGSSAWGSTTVVTCSLPSGVGTALKVKVSITGNGYNGLANSLFTYAAPTVTLVQPTAGPGAGGVPVTIYGTNLGFGGFPNTLLSVGGSGYSSSTGCTCDSTGTVVTCSSSPSGSGVNRPITVDVGAPAGPSCVSLSYGASAWSFDAPTISAVIPSKGPTLGEYNVTVVGSNFGTDNLQDVTVTLGDFYPAANCSRATDSYLVCVVVAGAGAGVTVKVTTPVTPLAERSVGSSGTAKIFSYLPPTITAAVAVPVSTSGTTAMTLIGINFGPIGTTIDFGVVTQLGGLSTVCASSTIVTDSTLTCTAPAGVGLNHTLSIARTMFTSYPAWVNTPDTVSSLQGAMSYAAPNVTSIANAGTFAPSSASPDITLYGASFGPARALAAPSEYLSLRYNSSTGTFDFPCSGAVVTTADTVLVCTPDAGGIGANLTLTLQVGPAADAVSGRLPASVSVPGAVSYPAPVISSITPASSPAVGVSDITIAGALFGAGAGVGSELRVFLGTFAVASPTLVSDTQIVLTAANVAGVGAGLSVTVLAGVENHLNPGSMPGAFTFDAPIVSSVSPASGSTVGAYNVTYVGLNFGPVPTGASSAFIGTYQCAVTLVVSDSLITCTVPAGAGNALGVEVVAAGTPGATLAAIFTYDAPNVTSLAPAGPYPTSLTTANGITLFGSNFGPNGTTVTVSLGTYPCTAPTLVSHSSLTCTHVPGSGASLPIAVTANLYAGVSASTVFSHQAPNVTKINPATDLPAGGILVTIYGSNFGFTGDGMARAITLGPSLACAPVSSLTDTSLVCKVPPGVGGSLAATVSVAGQLSPSTGASGTLFSYAAPVISNFAPATAAPVSGGTVTLTINGVNFGSFDHGSFLVQLGAAGSLGSQRANVSSPSVAYLSDTRVTITLPDFAGAPLSVWLWAGDQYALSTSNFSYAKPTVTAMVPMSGPVITVPGVTLLTLYGTNFGPLSYETAADSDGASGPLVGLIAGKFACVPVVPQTAATRSDSHVVCQQPTGAGVGLDVTVTVGGQSATTLLAAVFTYQPPVVTQAAFPSAGPKKGGTKITVTGKNFGPAELWNTTTVSVRIGGVPCATVTRLSDTVLTCITTNPGLTVVTPDMLPLAPSLPNGLIVTVEGQNSTNPAPTAFFTYIEYISPYCKTLIAEEFTGNVDERLRLGEIYFRNIATLDPFNMPNALTAADKVTRMVGTTPGTIGCVPRKSGTGLSTQHCYSSTRDEGANSTVDLIDADRCCATYETHPCGMHWMPGPAPYTTPNIITVTMNLFTTAYVNGLLISFFNPCVNTALLYNTRTVVGATSSLFYQRRTEVSDNPCAVMPGNRGAIALCQDYFTGLNLDNIVLDFDNSYNGPDGGWMMEFEVHGIYSTSPFRLLASPTTSVTQPSDFVTVFSIDVQTVSFDLDVIPNNILGALDKETSAMTATITYLDLALHPDRPPVGWGANGTISLPVVGGVVSFAALTLTTPIIGNYLVTFDSPGLRSVSVNLFVVEGAPNTIKVFRVDDGSALGAASVLRAQTSVLMPPFLIRALDPGLNFVNADLVYADIVVACLRALNVPFFAPGTCGTASVTAPSGPTGLISPMYNGSATFSNASGYPIMLERAARGRYEIIFTSSALGNATSFVDVGPGDPLAIFLRSPPSKVLTFPAAAVVPVVVDASGSPVATGVLDQGLNDTFSEVFPDPLNPNVTALRPWNVTLVSWPSTVVDPALAVVGNMYQPPTYASRFTWPGLTLMFAKVGTYVFEFSSVMASVNGSSAPLWGWSEGSTDYLFPCNLTVNILLGPEVGGVMELGPVGSPTPVALYQLPCTVATVLPDVTVWGVDGGLNRNLDPASNYNVTVAIAGGTPPVLGNTTVVTNYSTSSFHGLFLGRPKVGLYTLVARRMPGNVPYGSAVFEVVFGPATDYAVVNPSEWDIPYYSDAVVPLALFALVANDAGGNLVLDYNETVTVSCAYLAASSPSLFTFVNGTVNITGLLLSAPPELHHPLTFAPTNTSSVVNPVTVLVDVHVGQVMYLTVLSMPRGLRTAELVPLPAIQVQGLDAGGDLVGPIDVFDRDVTITLLPNPQGVAGFSASANSSGSAVASRTVTMTAGVAVFPAGMLGLSRPPPGTYLFSFTASANKPGTSPGGSASGSPVVAASVIVNITIGPGSIVIGSIHAIGGLVNATLASSAPAFLPNALRPAETVVVNSDDDVLLPTLSMWGRDAGGYELVFDPVLSAVFSAQVLPGGGPAVRTVGNGSDPLYPSLSGSTTASTLLGAVAGQADLSSLHLRSPRSGAYAVELRFVTRDPLAGIAYQVYPLLLNLQVLIGPARSTGSARGDPKSCMGFYNLPASGPARPLGASLVPASIDPSRSSEFDREDVSGAGGPTSLQTLSSCIYRASSQALNLGSFTFTALNSALEPLPPGADTATRTVSLSLELVTPQPQPEPPVNTDAHRRLPSDWPLVAPFPGPQPVNSTFFTHGPVTMDPALGSVTVSDMQLRGLYYLGVYRLRVSSPPLRDTFVKIVVVPGAPATTRVQVAPPAWHEPDAGGAWVFNADVVLQVVDAVDNPLRTDPTTRITVTARVYLLGANFSSLTSGSVELRSVLDPSATSIDDGRIVYPRGGLGFTGWRGQLYTMEFYSSLLPGSSSSAVVGIRPCNATVLRTTTNPSVPEECFCEPGYTLKEKASKFADGACVPCEDGFFKEAAGWGACTACTSLNTLSEKALYDTRTVNYYDSPSSPHASADPLAVFSKSQAELTGLGARNASRCRCSPGYFSKPSSPLDCMPCTEGGVCLGGASVFASKGFWRRTEESSTFFPCPNEEACEGGQNSSCKAGSEGPLCYKCSVGYGKVGTTCSVCPKNTYSWLLFAGSMVVIVGVLSFLIRSQLKTNWNMTTATVTQKILLNYLQMLSLFGSYNIKWPKSAARMFQISQGTSSFSSDLFTVDCAIHSTYYSKMLVYLVIPVVAIVAPITVFTLYFMLRRGLGTIISRPYQAPYSDVLNLAVLATMIILFMTHPTVSRQVMDIFNCKEMDGQSYLVADLTIKCDDPLYIFWRQVCFIILFTFCLGVPVYGFVLLTMLRKRLNLPSTRQRLGFLYIGLREERYYWELVTIIRKLGVVYCVVFINKNSVQQVFASIWLVQFSILGHLIFRPFQAALAHRLELASLVSGFITLMIGLMFEPSVGLPKVVTDYLVFALFAINGLTFACLVVFLVRGKVKQALAQNNDAETIDWRSIAANVFAEGQGDAANDLYWLFQEKEKALGDATLAEGYKGPMKSILLEMMLDRATPVLPDEADNIPDNVIDSYVLALKPTELTALDAIARSLNNDQRERDFGLGDEEDDDWDGWAEEDDGPAMAAPPSLLKASASSNDNTKIAGTASVVPPPPLGQAVVKPQVPASPQVPLAAPAKPQLPAAAPAKPQLPVAPKFAPAPSTAAPAATTPPLQQAQPNNAVARRMSVAPSAAAAAPAAPAAPAAAAAAPTQSNNALARRMSMAPSPSAPAPPPAPSPPAKK